LLLFLNLPAGDQKAQGLLVPGTPTPARKRNPDEGKKGRGSLQEHRPAERNANFKILVTSIPKSICGPREKEIGPNLLEVGKN
jgi:hypothetical protein